MVVAASPGRARPLAPMLTRVILILALMASAIWMHSQSDFSERTKVVQEVLLRKTVGGLQAALLTPSSQKDLPACVDDFHVDVRGSALTPHIPGPWPCLVRKPDGYEPPFDHARALWEVPRAALGPLDMKTPAYNLHIHMQRWAYMKDKVVTLRPEGGTAGRAFSDNFAYVRELLSAVTRSPRCGEHRPPVILDTGGGVGSVAAAFRDERGGGGRMKVLSYVKPDGYLRLHTIISHRLLPAYLTNFTGHFPFPDESLDVVHCKWCWHHMIGYDLWLNEVSRVLVPGGYFIFSFTPKHRDLLRHPDWEDSLEQQPFTCRRSQRIILICRKKLLSDGDKKDLPGGAIHDHCPNAVRVALESSDTDLRSRQYKLLSEKEMALGALSAMSPASVQQSGHLSRVVHVNCAQASACQTIADSDKSLTVTHIGASEPVMSALLARRNIAFQHDSKQMLPVYPRSFDLAYVGCDEGTKSLLTQKTFWADLHRVIRPGGGLIGMRAFCPHWNRDTIAVIESCGFETRSVGDDVFAARRKDIK